MSTKVLCRLPNHVGDCCMALPALRLLEASGFTPVLTGKRWAEDLFAGMGWRFDPIEGHVTEDFRRIRRLADLAGGSPLGLLFPNSFSSALLFRIGGIRSAGLATDGRSFLLEKAIPEPSKMHEVERFFHTTAEAVKAWGKTPAWEKAPEELGLRVLSRHKAAAHNLIEKFGIPERFALIAPIARGTHHGQNKCWPHFDELCVYLRSRDVAPIIFPSPHEVDEAKAACPNGIVLEPTTLGNYAALAQLARVVVANDSGISHIAAAVSAPQITVVGVTDLERTAPWNTRAAVCGEMGRWPTLDEVRSRLDTLIA